ncbi:MAG TPA: VPLPA-CTERM-specific exosortase XrtD [Terriglobales bacterium]|nr:VPLPA-CTERM-specific exosortase XrtD [Terriglobales bacterium]
MSPDPFVAPNDWNRLRRLGLSHMLKPRVMGEFAQVCSVDRKQGRVYFGLPWWQGVILLALIGYLYAPILGRLVVQWQHDPNFQHGFLVPAFSIFVIWQNRRKLKDYGSSPSWAGLFIIVGALIILALGDLGADLFLSRVSLIFLLAGLIILFRGWDFFRAVLFPWAVLFLMIPIPNLVLQNVTIPLQFLASRLATGLLREIGVPVLREGNVITIASMKLEVVVACSGIRSLLSLVTLAVIYGYLLERRNWVRVALAFSALPIAVVANGFRIFGTGVMGQHWGPERAEGFFHSFSGLLVFAASLFLLFAVHAVINWLTKGRGTNFLPEDHATPRRNGLGSSLPERPSAGFAVAVLLIVAATAALHLRSQTEVFPARVPLSSFPQDLDRWTGKDLAIDDQSLEVLGPGEFLHRDYSSSDAHPPADLFVAYYPSQRAAEGPHSPEHCLLGAGYIPISRSVVPLPGMSSPVNRFVTSKNGTRQVVLFWFQAHGRVMANGYVAKYYLVHDALLMNRSDGSLIRLMIDMAPNESAEAAQERLWSFGQHVVPLLDQYIPR